MARRNKKATHSSSRGRGFRSVRGGYRGAQGPGRQDGLSQFSSRLNPEAAAFTLADEARQTSQHDHSFSSNLRQKPVLFVSAGTSEPLKLLDKLDEGDRLTSSEVEHTEPVSSPLPHLSAEKQVSEIEHERAGETRDDKDDAKFIGPEDLEKEIEMETRPQKDAEPDQLFFYDLSGEPSQNEKRPGPVPIPERPSSSSSDSSEEVILFKGRDAQRNIRARPAEEINFTQMEAEIKVVEEEIRITPEIPSNMQDYGMSDRQNRRRRRKRRTEKQEDEDAIIADYIANMDENGEADGFLQQFANSNRRDLGGTESDHASSSTSDESQIDAGKHQDTDDQDDEGHEEDDLDAEDELDDEMLARLIAGHELDTGGNESDTSDSSDADPSESQRPKGEMTAHDDFDLMDWYRPSLRRRKAKGARAQITFNVSDSEMEQRLQAAWKSDRLKKSERKQRREELRAKGLLDKNAKPDDLTVKYPHGMDLQQVGEEIRAFLLGSGETLAFPPMDNHARKMIHDLANKFKLKSKSTGKADHRRPVLYRTGRTIPYVESTFDQAVGRIARRYFPRLDIKGKRKPGTTTTRSSTAAAVYRDGEVVGAAAPELSIENRGRVMLEKMGWSRGTALGATNNKGILQPVTHTMKSSKAGLG